MASLRLAGGGLFYGVTISYFCREMKQQYLAGLAEAPFELSEGWISDFFARYFELPAHPDSGEANSFHVPMPGGSVCVRFKPMTDTRLGILCIVEWLADHQDLRGLPPWEFHLQDGRFDERSHERMLQLVQWISSSHWHKPREHKVFSRCQEEHVGFPLFNGEERILPVREIICLQAERDWTRVRYGHDQRIDSVLVERSISKCEQDLIPYGFLRIHRSYIVNPGCIRQCKGRELKNRLELCDGSMLPVARRRCADLRERLAVIRSKSDHLSENSESIQDTL